MDATHETSNSSLLEMTRSLSSLAQREVSRVCREHGMTISQMDVLNVLDARGPLSVGQIRDQLNGTDGNIPVIISNLLRQGMVTRKQDEVDRRRTIVSITSAGKKALKQVRPAERDALEHFFAAWCPRDRRAFTELCEKIVPHTDVSKNR